MDAYAQLAFNDEELGQYEKSLENLDKAIRLSPHNSSLHYWYASKATAHFALKQYEEAIEWARRAIAIDPTFRQSHPMLIAALGWTGRQAEFAEIRLPFFPPSVAWNRCEIAAKCVTHRRPAPHLPASRG